MSRSSVTRKPKVLHRALTRPKATDPYRCFYDSMAKFERVEFRVRLSNPEVAASASEAQGAVSTAVAEVQLAVTAAFAKEHTESR